ncbi:MAG: DUF4388 domain-containing protein [Myxococcales bacterium FL481]|nr:MAG: DUF4388 domain-containing protein [Myxococcales bacterium FL481]
MASLLGGRNAMHSRLHLLIICPDPAEGEALVRAVHGETDTIHAATVSTPEQLSQIMAQGMPHVVLGDLQMVSVLEELRNNLPQLPILGMTRRTDEQQVDTVVRLRMSAILRAPVEASDLLRVLNAPAPSSEFVGHCRGISSAMLLALHCQARNEGVLHFRHGSDGRIGSIHLESGQPIHASSNGQVGEPVVRELLNWPESTVTWVPGSSDCARTIVGRWEGLLQHGSTRQEGHARYTVPVAFPEVMEKLARLAQTPDILGAFLLQNAEVVTGRCSAGLDEAVMGRALCRLAHVFHDVEAQAEDPGTEIQATVGQLRLVVDRIGPATIGFQVGVIVRQASPVCKSLRRLLRQIDRSFVKAMRKAEDGRGNNELAVA